MATYLWVGHLSAITHAGHVIDHFLRAATQGQGCGKPPSSYGTDTSGIGEANLREEESYSDACCCLDSCRNELHQPLTHARQGEEDEDQALNEDSSERCLV